MKTYLVTGGAGFIGSNFVLHMLASHDDVRIVNVDLLTYAGNLENLSSVADDPRYAFVQADIADRAAMAAVFSEYDPDYVVNFAAESHVDRSIEDPAAFARTNVMGTVCLLDLAREAWALPEGGFREGVKFLQVSTDEVYGTLSLDEPDTFFTEETPLSPHSPYSASKASADMFVVAYHDTFGLPVNITRCSNNYGPYQFPEKLIPLMINNALHHESLPVYGDGLNVRDWLYVEDHCRAIDAVIAEGRDGEAYNVGGHNERSNAYIVDTVVSEVSRATDDPEITGDLIVHVADRLGHDRRYGIDPAKIGEELGWTPETRFEDGIVATIQWYLANGEWMDHVTSGAYQDYYQEMYGDRERIDGEED